MKNATSAIMVTCSLLGLAACSSSLSSPSSTLPASATEATRYHSLPSLAIASQFKLAVSDNQAESLEIFNGKYSKVQTITDGINNPSGDYYDRRGNLYVANSGNYYTESGDVSEYDANGNLTHTYANGLRYPVGVTVDSNLNVYVADYYGPYSTKGGIVAEFQQGSATPVVTCDTGLLNQGVAVDNSGNVFVSGNTTSGYGSLLEYVGGLSGCRSRTLSAKILTTAGGLQLDSRNRLLVCDQGLGIAVIPPPYNKVTRTIQIVSMHPYNLALNKLNSRLFVADIANSSIWLIDYPSGKLRTYLNQSYGFATPFGVAKYPVAN